MTTGGECAIRCGHLSLHETNVRHRSKHRQPDQGGGKRVEHRCQHPPERRRPQQHAEVVVAPEQPAVQAQLELVVVRQKEATARGAVAREPHHLAGPLAQLRFFFSCIIPGND